MLGVSIERVLWVLRQEKGELNGREHLHAVFAGFPEYVLNVRTCFSLIACWQHEVGGGWSQFRLWEKGLDALSYITKPPSWSFASANDYESSKFGNRACEVIVSQSAENILHALRAFRGVHSARRSRHNAESAERRIQETTTLSARSIGLNRSPEGPGSAPKPSTVKETSDSARQGARELRVEWLPESPQSGIWKARCSTVSPSSEGQLSGGRGQGSIAAGEDPKRA